MPAYSILHKLPLIVRGVGGVGAANLFVKRGSFYETITEPIFNNLQENGAFKITQTMTNTKNQVIV